MTRGRRLAWVTGVTLWCSAVTGGTGLFMLTSFAADRPADARVGWPAGLDLPRAAGGRTVVVCLHPRCPCSEATLDALADLLAALPPETAARTNAYALFAVPDATSLAAPSLGASDARWTDTALIARARGVSGLDVRIDPGGRLCAALGARASGQAFCFDAAGRLLFEGGVTPGRGERGDAIGLTRLTDAVRDGTSVGGSAATPVFGCALPRPQTPNSQTANPQFANPQTPKVFTR